MARILIVDDEAPIVNMLETIFELASFEVKTARSAEEAKSRLQETSFDVVMTDMRMEKPNSGYDVVRAARQLQPRPAIAILTAFPISPAEWRPSGADALLIKGMDVLDLPRKLQALIKSRAA